MSYWDAGLVLLDVSDPTNPRMLSQTLYEPGAEGNTHVAVPAAGGNLVVVGDEDFSPRLGGDPVWGFGRVFDTQNEPVEVATFDTGNVRDDPFGVLPTAAEMWGVYVHRSLVPGSDMNSGLWILRQTK